VRVPRRLSVALAIAAAASLGVPAHALAASGTTAAAARVPCADPVVADPVGGEAAVLELGSDLPEAAANIGRTPAQYRRLLRSDPTLRVDGCARTFVVDPESGLAAPGAGLTSVADANGPLDESGDALTLSSRPGSKRTIFLDFDGTSMSGTQWITDFPFGRTDATGYSLDTLPTFSDLERNNIRSIWLRVAEDYAPFDVNVTTEDPGQPAITREDAKDDVYGTRALITGDLALSDAVCD
jgi:hypothetical protein